MRRIVFAFALTLIFSLAAAAQGVTNFADGERRPIVQYTGAIDGMEVAPGVYHEGGAVRTGTTYSADISGPLAGHFTAVFDYSAPDPTPETGNQIVRGSWTLAVYHRGLYQGTLFGEITNGSMEWKSNGKEVLFGVISADLTIKGGTKGLSDVPGGEAFGNFEIQWEGTPKGATTALPALSGTLVLTF